MPLSREDATAEAMAYIAENNADGRYDTVLRAVAADAVDIGLLRYEGVGLFNLQKSLDRYNVLLAGDAEALLDIDVPSVTAARDNVLAAIRSAEDFRANPVVYMIRKD